MLKILRYHGCTISIFFLAADAESLQVIRGSAGLPETEHTPFYDGRDGGRDIDTVLCHLFPIH